MHRKIATGLRKLCSTTDAASALSAGLVGRSLRQVRLDRTGEAGQ